MSLWKGDFPWDRRWVDDEAFGSEHSFAYY